MYCVVNTLPVSHIFTMSFIHTGTGNKSELDTSLPLWLAVNNPVYFDNENDEVLRKYNQLQAKWGAGKGFYAPYMPPVEFTPENPYCSLKVVCYSRISTFCTELGLVEVVIGRSLAEVRPYMQQILMTLTLLSYGIEVVVKDIYEESFIQKTHICLYVLRKTFSGRKERAKATEVAFYLHAPSNARTLENLCIQEVTPQLSLSEAQMKAYLDTPQRGINPALWELGIKNNPDPKTYIPVVKIGFLELEKKSIDLEKHSAELQAKMKDMMEEITQLQQKQDMMNSALRRAMLMQNNLTTRILRLMSAHELQEKKGTPFGMTEESLCLELENVHLQLNKYPVSYRRMLDEIMDKVPATRGEFFDIHHLDVKKEETIMERLVRLQIDMETMVCGLKKQMQVFSKAKE